MGLVADVSVNEAGQRVTHDAVEATPARPSRANPEIEASVRAAIASGDHRAALEQLDDAYGEALYGYIRQFVGDDDLADDLFQVTLVEAFRDLGTYAGQSTLRTWLYGIARHRCLDAVKAKRRWHARFSSEEATEPPDNRPHAEQLLSTAQLLAALDRCLSKLAPEARMVLLLRFQEELSYDEIARIAREKPETLRARVSRAMPVLRRCVESGGAR
jgi:RNA polymerase sigma-70 factor (ECF subfamily)